MRKLDLFLVDLLEHHESKWGKMFGYFLVTIIIASTTSFILSTTSLGHQYKTWLHYFDLFVFGFFSLESFCRFWISSQKKFFIFKPLEIIDLIVLFSFYSHFSNLVFLRGFRVLRIFQMLKIARYSELMLSFFRSFRYYRDEIKIFVVTLLMVLILSSCGMYYLEHNQPESYIKTIPQALWWSIVTISTVGYGDTVPITIGGKMLASLIVWMGLGTTAIMTALITKIFIDHFFGKRMHHCEFCHYPHHDHDAKFCKNCGGKLDVKKLDLAGKLGR